MKYSKPKVLAKTSKKKEVTNMSGNVRCGGSC